MRVRYSRFLCEYVTGTILKLIGYGYQMVRKCDFTPDRNVEHWAYDKALKQIFHLCT